MQSWFSRRAFPRCLAWLWQRQPSSAVTFPAGLVGTALAALAASTILSIGTGGILAVSARSAAALTLTSLMVVGLGAVLGSAAGTITTAVAVLFAPPILGALVSTRSSRRS